MNLKNYTSDVPASQTIFKIQSILIKARVTNIAMDYGPDGEVIAVTFGVQVVAEKPPMLIRMPANVDACQRALWTAYVDGDKTYTAASGDEYIGWGNKKKKRSDFREQAKRTAWKIVQDWLEVQLSMIALEQAEFAQVFLPYFWDGKQSFYSRLKQDNFLALPPSPS